MLEGELPSKGLFDLLSEKNRVTQRAIENSWNEKNDIQLTNSEWFILERINYRKEPLADVSKNGEITRQGTHKLIRKLEKQGLVITEKMDDTKPNKLVQLTPLGIACYEKNKALKLAMEHDIRNVLGEESYHKLLTILAADWHM